MTGLLIDTSTEKSCFAISKKEKILFQAYLPEGFNNSQSLLPEIEKGLNSLQLDCQQLDYVAVGVGPGSYTGIRVAVIVAKTLAFACQIPLVSVSSLLGFIPQQEGAFAALIDAKISGLYVQKGVKEKGVISYQNGPQVVAFSAAGEWLNDVQTLVTPNSKQISLKLKALYPNQSWKWEESHPNIPHLISSCYEKYTKGQGISEGQLEILYLRKTQAEIEREKNRNYVGNQKSGS